MKKYTTNGITVLLIKEIRLRNKVRQIDIPDMCSLTKSQAQKMEKGNIKTTITVIHELSKAFNFTMTDFFKMVETVEEKLMLNGWVKTIGYQNDDLLKLASKFFKSEKFKSERQFSLLHDIVPLRICP